MRAIHTRIEIDAPAAVVWRILTDLPRYGTWNPLIPGAKGELRRGSYLEIKIKTPDRVAQSYRVRILKIEQQKELWWLGHFWIPGLIDGTHMFDIRPLPHGRTELVQRESFRGLLVPFTWKGFLDKYLRSGFEASNRGLKIAAEQAVGIGERS